MTRKEKEFIKQTVGKYKSNYMLYLLLVIIMSVFSVSSILSLNNFLQILFSTKDEVTVSSSDLDKLLNNIYGFFLTFGKHKALVFFTLIILVIYLLKDIFTWLSQYQIGQTRNLIVRDIRSLLFEKFSSQDISFIGEYKKGDLLSRFSSDIVEFEETILKSIQTIINSAITVLIYFAMLLYINSFLTLCALLLFPIVALLTSILSRKLRRSARQMQDSNAQLVANIEETIGGIRIIKSMSAISYMNNRFNDFNKDYARLRTKVYRKIDLASPQSEVFSSIVIAVLLLIGSSLVINTSQLSATMFIVYLILFILIIKPAKDSSTAYYNLKRGTASLNRITEITSSANIIKEPKISKNFPKLNKGIIFKNVNFAYTREQQVLKNINFTFEKGKTTAIVGTSGSGKTTMTDLIEKFYQLNSDCGDILFDDISVNDMSGEEIRKNIAVVTQETVLFNDTITNNIAFGGDYSQQEIISAAKTANAMEFIEQLPQKFETNIGDKGNMLSGGQKQRISIARAVLKDSPILILDEATSALDTESERKVQEALDNIAKGRTTIIIAHRLSTIVGADKIVVLQDGQIKEQGTHGELYKLGGIYYNLYLMQQVG
ncbi:MAG: ABC transporter ATP-binding protein [Bacteroidales bacterium]